MKTKLISAILLILLGFGVLLVKNQTTPNTCRIRNPDPDGYLLKICQYLHQHQDTITPNQEPSSYTIKKIESGWPGLIENGREMSTDTILIHLDCCGTGDIAFVDKSTKEVIYFSPGDK